MKDRDVTTNTKVKLTETLVFPVMMYGCESWTMRKAERRRIDAFEMWCWRRVLRIPWTARRTNKSVLEEIKPEMPLESKIQQQKLKYFGHVMRKDNSIEKYIMLGKVEGKRRRGRQRMRCIDGVKEIMGKSINELAMECLDRQKWRKSVQEVTRSRTRLEG